MFYYLSSLAIMVFEMICCKIFYESFCNNQNGKGKVKKVLLLGTMLVLEYVCIIYLAQWLILKVAVLILIIAYFMQQYFLINFKKSVVLAILFQGILLLVDYIIYSVSSALFTSVEEIEQHYVMEGSLIIVFGKIVLFLCIMLIKKQFGKRKTERLSDTQWIRFLFFPIFTIITIAAMIMTFQYIENETQVKVLYTIAFGMVVMNVFVYYLIGDIVDRDSQLYEKKMFELEVKNQMEIYRSISENFEKQKNKAHEFKNQILCIESLLKNMDYEELNNYVKGISNNISHEQNTINTNHVIINAILNSKYQEAIKKQIVVVIRVNNLSGIAMEDGDIVILLANLLNNAIEACEKCKKVSKVIKVKFLIEDDTMVLSVKNTYENAIIYENNEIRTSKTMLPEEHGIGIKNIVRVVKKYKGSYVVKNENNEFFFSILIPM